MDILRMIKGVFSIDAVIYLAILFVFFAALIISVFPLTRLTAKLRRASRLVITESKQQKEKKSWNDIHFLGDRLQSVWTDFLQNAEIRDAHGDTCDVSRYINEDTVIYAAGGTRFAEMAPKSTLRWKRGWRRHS